MPRLTFGIPSEESYKKKKTEIDRKKERTNEGKKIRTKKEIEKKM